MAFMATDRPSVALALPAREESVLTTRHALRAFGRAVGAVPAALEDTEVAAGEAVRLAVDPAFGRGLVEVGLEAQTGTLTIGVRRGGDAVATLEVPLDDDQPQSTAADRIEAMVRRLTVVVAALDGVEVDRLAGVLRTAGWAARRGLRHITSQTAVATFDRLAHGTEMRLRPLGAGGGEISISVAMNA